MVSAWEWEIMDPAPPGPQKSGVVRRLPSAMRATISQSASARAALTAAEGWKGSQMGLTPHRMPNGSALLGGGVSTAKSPICRVASWAKVGAATSTPRIRHVRLPKERCFKPKDSRGSSATSAFRKPVCAMTWIMVRQDRP